MSISALKKKSASNLAALRDALNPEKQKKGGYTPDPNYWRPSLDQESGTGYAEIRFLDAPEGEDFPFVKWYEHSWTGKTGKKYYEKSRTSIGQVDAVGELNSRLWNSGVESDKDVARTQKRKTKYCSNILVIDDTAHPENNGKVFKFVYGEKIFALPSGLLNPEFAKEEAVDPFNLWTGRNIILKIRILKTGNDNFWNYDKSVVAPVSTPVAGSDAEIEAIWKQCHSLAKLMDPSEFKSYDQLASRLLEINGPTSGSGIATVVGSAAPAAPRPSPVFEKTPVRVDAPVEAPKVLAKVVVAAPAEEAGDDGDEDYFKKLMQSG